MPQNIALSLRTLLWGWKSLHFHLSVRTLLWGWKSLHFHLSVRTLLWGWKSLHFHFSRRTLSWGCKTLNFQRWKCNVFHDYVFRQRLQVEKTYLFALSDDFKSTFTEFSVQTLVAKRQMLTANTTYFHIFFFTVGLKWASRFISVFF